MNQTQIENIVSACSPPDLGKVDNFAATVYLVKKYEECKELAEQNYEVVVSKLNSKVDSNFYQVFNHGINKNWPDSYVQNRETDYERLVLTNDGKEAYTKMLNVLNLSYKTISPDQKEKLQLKENNILSFADSSEDINQEKKQKPAKRKLFEIVSDKKKKPKDELLKVTLTSNFPGEPDYNEQMHEGTVVNVNKYDDDLRVFIKNNLLSNQRWYDFVFKKWIVKGKEAEDKLLDI